MKKYNTINIIIFILLFFTVSAMRMDPARAHCDTMDGPVIIDAKKALDSGNVNLVLAWVKSDGEWEIRSAFATAIGARKTSSSKEAADRAFFETLVKVHRAGEGAGYEGIKPAGSELNPAVRAADKAIADGKIQPVIDLLNKSLSEKVSGKYVNASGRKNYDPNDVAAGREYVKAYVEYVHFVEGMYNAFNQAGGRHEAEGHGHAAGHAGHEAHVQMILTTLIGLLLGSGMMFAIMKRRVRS